MPVLSQIPNIIACWKLVNNLSNINFIDYFGKNCPDINLGCTFSPEACNSTEHAWFCLTWCVQNLGLRNIRFGLRWDNIEEVEGVINLSYYQPFLEYLIAQKVEVTLAVGPVKAPRWPEEHIPNWVWQKTNKPHAYSKIRQQDVLAQLGLNYLERLLPQLSLLFQHQHLAAIQVENEPFNPFGWLKVRASQGYLQQAISLVHQYFPNKPILLNSAGRFNLRAIIKQIQSWPNLQFTLGIDYYYTHNFLVKFGTSAFLDPIAVSFLWDISIKKLQKIAEKNQFSVEVTEAQMEPWGRATEPGNSANALKYVLLRCGKTILNGNGLIRLWGIEYVSLQFFEGRETIEHQEMAEIIKALSNN